VPPALHFVECGGGGCERIARSGWNAAAAAAAAAATY